MNAQPPLFPIILPDRQERFCLLFVQGLSGTEAYKQAYSSTSDKVAGVNSSRMLGRARVQQRITQLRADSAALQRVSLPNLTRDLRRVGLLAEGSGQHSAAVAAYMGIAKLHGLLIDRQQVDLLVRRPSGSPEAPDEMTEEDWLSRHGLSIDQEEPKTIQVIEHNSDEQEV